MLYVEFMRQAKDAVIERCESNEMYYLRPDYRRVLDDLGLHEDEITDWIVDPYAIEDELKLQVARLNTCNDKTRYVLGWLYQVLSSGIQPAIEDKENEMLADLVEYMQTKERIVDKEKQVETRERAVEQKENVRKISAGMSFSKL